VAKESGQQSKESLQHAEESTVVIDLVDLDPQLVATTARRMAAAKINFLIVFVFLSAYLTRSIIHNHMKKGLIFVNIFLHLFGVHQISINNKKI
jgi:hypothetical protein